MPAIKEAEASWKFLLPSAKNLTVLEPELNFDNLILLSGMVDSIEVAVEKDILPPHQIAKAVDELDREIHEAIQAKHLKSQQETKAIADMLEAFKEKIIVNEVHLEELEIDQMNADFVNNVDMRPNPHRILPEGDQYFTHPLRASDLTIHDVEVESLCGIPPECKFELDNFYNANLFMHIDLYKR